MGQWFNPRASLKIKHNNEIYYLFPREKPDKQVTIRLDFEIPNARRSRYTYAKTSANYRSDFPGSSHRICYTRYSSEQWQINGEPDYLPSNDSGRWPIPIQSHRRRLPRCRVRDLIQINVCYFPYKKISYRRNPCTNKSPVSIFLWCTLFIFSVFL
jgi:hypothetical protein